ncbi:4735_t:CDS:2 [Rhizophagus irregularis]|nr:4735_t:CDS:2 [Rhizophagus irregularis]
MVDIELVYNLSIHKLQNFQSTRRDSDGLRKLVLLNNFVYEKFVSPEPDVDLLEWSEEDIKKDEESWLDSCLDELDEDDYVHVNVKPLDNQPTVSTFPIDHDDINMTKISSSFEYLSSEKGFHPYWKDNSIIGQIGHPSSRSFGIPKIFHKYRFDQVVDSSSPRRISPPNAVLELLQSNYIDSPLRRSKDDLDILYSLTPKDLDRGILMDMISMLEYYGSKANHNIAKNSSEINDMWFMDNNHR